MTKERMIEIEIESEVEYLHKMKQHFSRLMEHIINDDKHKAYYFIGHYINEIETRIGQIFVEEESMEED